jgi:hypothetical protein
LQSWDPTYHPIHRKRFLEICETYGLNDTLASDLWYSRPPDKMNSTEDEVIANMELWTREDRNRVERLNEAAKIMKRHRFVFKPRGRIADKCETCGRETRSPIHNMEPLSHLLKP